MDVLWDNYRKPYMQQDLQVQDVQVFTTPAYATGNSVSA
jgi:hypothetical protein